MVVVWLSLFRILVALEFFSIALKGNWVIELFV